MQNSLHIMHAYQLTIIQKEAQWKNTSWDFFLVKS